MGLQIWSPSEPVLSSMACLDVESPSICRGKFKSVLQLCLQQRRTREQLVEQGILPPLKTPTAFHKQIRSLERARTGNFLKHKLCSRPERSELVRMHILEETQAEPSLQATQIKLKRARLANDLNEKISQRPGPMELVEKKILPVDFGVEKLGNGREADKSEAPRVPDVYSFDEDSSDASSPQQPNSQQSPFSSSPKESRQTEASCSSSNSSTPLQLSPALSSTSTSNAVVSTSELKSNQQTRQPSGPLLVKQSLAKLTDKSRGKKGKEPKPRVKKLKYHQYVPPDQKQELSDVPMDSSYARLLQQQQQFLHLQILSQQQQQYNQQAVLPVTLKYDTNQHKPFRNTHNISTTEVQSSCSAVVLRGNTPSAPVQLHNTNRKPDHLPANLDEMKVAELKLELKLRSLPVSGTKTDLIERLKLFQGSSYIQHTVTMETASQSENLKFSPPVSLIASKVSKLGIEDGSKTDSSAKAVSDTPPGTVPCTNSSHAECPTETKSKQRDSEKDKRLHEKERQIEELMKKLQQEQKLVEELKMQLEVEKRSQQSDSPPQLNPLLPVHVKEETRTASACSVSCSSPVPPGLVKQEESADSNHAATSKPFIIAQQTITRAETLQCVKAGAQILLPAVAVAVELPAKSLNLQTPASSAAPGHIQTSGQVPQKADISAALQQRATSQTQQMTKTWMMNIKAENLLNRFPETGCDGASPSQAVPNEKMSPCSGQSSVISRPTKFTNVSKSKDPPRYEDAVKQTRSILPAAQGPTAASQQMDDLFDVLIESGEMSPFARQNPPSLEKPLPVTASVSTLPVNTVLSRPPPLVQVAQMPVAPLGPSTDLEPLSSRNELETLLDSTLVSDAEAQKLKLMEELNSPVVTMEVNFSENVPPSGVNLANGTVESMDWLDLTLSVPAEGINPLDMSVPEGVFSSDFLDSHELQLNWD